MAIKVGINGFGRIGRNIMRAAMDDSGIDIVAVNDLTNADTLAHLLKYDSILGNLKADISAEGRPDHRQSRRVPGLVGEGPGAAALEVARRGRRVRVDGHLHESRRRGKASGRRGEEGRRSRRRPKGPTSRVVLGVNEDKYDPAKHHIISNASCTTNCLAPIAKVLHETFGIRKGWMTTVHSYTNDQQLLDLPHKDSATRPRRGAVDHPDDHRRSGCGWRGAAGDQGAARRDLDARADAERLGRGPGGARRQEDDEGRGERGVQGAADGKLKGILEYTEEPLVSIDFRGNPHSSILDAPYTSVMDADFIKVLSWYDNEWGYSNRCVDLLRYPRQEGTLSVAAQHHGSRPRRQAGVHPRRLQRADQERHDRRRHAHPRVAADDSVRARAGRDGRSRVASGPAQGQAESRVLAEAGRRRGSWSCSAGRSSSPNDCDRRGRLERQSTGRRRGQSGAAREPALPPEEEKNDSGVRQAARGARRRLRQRRVRLGASRARVDRRHRPSRQGSGRGPADGGRGRSISGGSSSIPIGRSSRCSAAPRCPTSSR